MTPEQMATNQTERPTDLIEFVKREEYSKAAFKSDVVCALVNYIEQIEQELQDLKDSQIIEVKGDAVLEGDWEVWLDPCGEWHPVTSGDSVSGDPDYRHLVQKRKPEPTKEERFREALAAEGVRLFYREVAIDAAREAGLL